MQPKFALPAQEAGRTINLETKPKQVRAWLDGLPLSDPGVCAQAILEYLRTVNRAALPEDTRAKLMELLDHTLQETLGALHALYKGNPLPLAAKPAALARLAGELLEEAGYAYKALILSGVDKRFRLFGGNPLPGYLRKLLALQRQVLELGFELHEPAAAGTWLELHQAYALARHHELLEATPGEGGIEEQYKAALLLGIADPYRMPQHELPWTRDFIARFGHLAGLTPNADGKPAVGVFAVDPLADAPPFPLARERDPLRNKSPLMLNTVALVKHLSLLANHLQHQPDRSDNGLPAAARDPAYPPFLQRLKRQWSAALQRQSKRRPDEECTEYEVCFGVRALLLQLSAAAGPGGESVTCRVVNSSIGGLALASQGGVSFQIKVGDLVGLRQPEGRQWGVGIVRWFRIPRRGDVMFGLQWLAPQARAVELRREGDPRRWAGLLLPPSPNLKQEALLVSVPGLLAPGARVSILAGGDTQQVTLGPRTEYTPNLEAYRLPTQAP